MAAVLLFCLMLFWMAASLAPTASQTVFANSELRVRVYTSEGPVVGAGVLITSTGDADRAGRTVYTDEAGEVIVADLRTGSYQVRVVKPSLYIGEEDAVALSEVSLTNGQTLTLAVGMRKGGVLTGRVLGGEGRPVSGLSVTPLLLSGGASGWRAPSALESNVTALTDDRGVFRLYGLRPGRYAIGINTQRAFSIRREVQAFFYPGLGTLSPKHVLAVAEGQEIALPDLQASEGSRASSSILAMVTREGRPVAGAKLSLSQPGGGISDETLTGPTGEFIFEALPPGVYRVSAVGGGGEPFEVGRDITLTGAGLSRIKLEAPAETATVVGWTADGGCRLFSIYLVPAKSRIGGEGATPAARCEGASFLFHSIKPGKYFLVALRRPEASNTSQSRDAVGERGSAAHRLGESLQTARLKTSDQILLKAGRQNAPVAPIILR